MISKAFRPFLYILYGLSFLARRNKNLWAFGGDYNAFSNGKYLAKYIQENHPDITVVWLVRKHIDVSKIRRDGYEAYYQWSFNGIKKSLQTKYQFLNSYIFDINYWLSGGSVITNLWHGVPLKKLNYDIEKGPSARLFNPKFVPLWFARIFILRLKSSKYFLATSEMTQKLFSRSFKVALPNCIIDGYPRNDVIFNKNIPVSPELEPLVNSVEKIIMYMPTWRDSGNDFLKDTGINFDELNNVLIERKCNFLLKLHPLTKLDTSAIENYSNINVLPNSVDVYPLLSSVDVLITDYSSIYIDFLLTNNLLMFYPFDLAKYQSQDRDLYFDYEEYTPGPKAYNGDELIGLIRDVDTIKETYFEKYNHQEIKEKFWKYEDGKSSERLVNFFQELNNK